MPSRIYLVSGLALVVGAYVVTPSAWFDSTFNGVYIGGYVASAYADAPGETGLVLAIFFLSLPAMAWFFSRGTRRALRREVAP